MYIHKKAITESPKFWYHNPNLTDTKNRTAGYFESYWLNKLSPENYYDPRIINYENGESIAHVLASLG